MSQMQTRPRKSVNPKRKGDPPVPRNPIEVHSMQDDMPLIMKYAGDFLGFSDAEKEVLSVYVAREASLEYYYGCFVTAYQTYVIAHLSNSPIEVSYMQLLCAICAQIVAKK